jgi:gas vesicle protein
MADKSGDFLAGFFVGALVGAAAALLLAPQSGEETRALIRDKGIELQERSAEMSAEARRRAAEIQVQTKERAADTQAKLKEAVDQGKTAASEKKAQLLTQLETEQPAEETPGAA